jgi:hypothetical protein
MQDGRGKVWISQYQSLLVRRMLLYWVVFQLTVVNILFVWGCLSIGDRPLLEYFTGFLPGMLPMLLCFLFLAPFFCWDAVRVAHRLVGPLARFRRSIRGLAEGDTVPVIELRKEDLLQDMKDELNGLIHRVQGGRRAESKPLPLTEPTAASAGEAK